MIYMKNMSQLLRQSWYVDSGLVVWPLAGIQINRKISFWPKAGHCLKHISPGLQLVRELSAGRILDLPWWSATGKKVIISMQPHVVRDDKLRLVV